MPVLQKNPNYLTVGEAQRRLKENPDDPDPEVQAYKKANEKFITSLSSLTLGIQPKFLGSYALFDPAIFSNPLLKMINQFTESKSTFADSLVNLARSPLFDAINSFKNPLFTQALESVNPGLTIAKEITKKQHSLFDDINKAITEALKPPEFEMPEITYIPPTRDHETRVTLTRIEAKIDAYLSIENRGYEEIGEVSSERMKLIDLYPADNRKYRVNLKMMDLLVRRAKVDFYLLARCIKPGLTKKQYRCNKKSYLDLLENCITAMRRKIKELGFIIRTKREVAWLSQVYTGEVVNSVFSDENSFE